MHTSQSLTWITELVASLVGVEASIARTLIMGVWNPLHSEGGDGLASLATWQASILTK